MPRSDFIVHWTGKDIHTEVTELTDDHRHKYLDRLFNILEFGFWMNTPKESLVGRNPINQKTLVRLNYEVPMTCFSEERLTTSASHTKKFGLLGIGVDRRFILDRFGGPVHYVRNHFGDYIVSAYAGIRKWIEQRFEESQKLDPNSAQTKNAENALGQANYFGAFLKPMSTACLKPDEKDDFSFIDEHEWRIAFMPALIQMGWATEHGNGPPEYKLLLNVEDIGLLVLPDEITRKMALADPRFKSRLLDKGVYPPVLILADRDSL